jgi:NAD(P)-dependent dehydrogenase (short-subunit alcohol dehydrogenase family)
MEIRNRAASMLSLEGRVALISGAASGIGRQIAVRLAELGCDVVILDVNSAGALETIAQIAHAGGKAIFIQCDVRSGTACQKAVGQALDRYKQLDILCNNAGVIIRKDAVDLSEHEWDTVLDVSLKGTYLLSHEVIPHMIRSGGGSIVNTGSGWSLTGGPKAAAYCAAKAGVLNLTRAMAIDHGKHNIRVNCVCPGDIDTPMLADECRQLREDPAQFMREAALRPLNRIGTPDDVAAAVLFFASDMSRWITGAYLVVDGGGLA